MAKNKSQAMSLKSADATQGGGIAGALATITEIENVQEFEYPGGAGNGAQAALRVVFEIEGQDKPWEQHYTYGKSERYTVIDDGDAIEGPGLNKNCNAYRFLSAAEEAEGYDGFHDDGTISEYRDRQVRLKNLKYETVGGDQKDLIVIGEFVDGDAAPKASGKSGKASAGKSSSKGQSLEEKAQAAALAVVTEEEKVKKADLPGLVFQANKKDADAKAIMQLCFKEAFISSIPGVDYDKKRGLLTVAESDDEDGDDE